MGYVIMIALVLLYWGVLSVTLQWLAPHQEEEVVSWHAPSANRTQLEMEGA